MAADEAEIQKGMLLAKLHSLEAMELAEICVGLNVQIAPNKKGKKAAIYNLIVRHFSEPAVEDSDDNGLEMFTDCLGQVEEKLKAKAPATPAVVKDENAADANAAATGDKKDNATVAAVVKVEELGKGIAQTPAGSSTNTVESVISRKVEHIRFREFKITGGSVASGASDQLDFSSVC